MRFTFYKAKMHFSFGSQIYLLLADSAIEDIHSEKLKFPYVCKIPLANTEGSTCCTVLSIFMFLGQANKIETGTL